MTTHLFEVPPAPRFQLVMILHWRDMQDDELYFSIEVHTAQKTQRSRALYFITTILAEILMR